MFTNDLVFNKWQIHYQDLSRCIASTKDLKPYFGASAVFGPSQEGFKWRLQEDEDLSLGLFLEDFILVKM